MKEQRQASPLKRLSALGASVALAAAFAIPAVSPADAWAEPTSASLQAEAQSVLASLESMQAQLDAASDDYYAALEEQDAARTKMDESQQRIDEAEDQIDDLQSRLSDRAKTMYRNGSSTMIDVLLGASSFTEFATTWDLLDRLNENDSELIDQTKTLRQQIAEEKALYEEQERVAAQKAEEAAAIQQEAEKTVASMQATYDSLSAEAAALLEQERQAQIAAEAAVADQVVQDAIESAPSANQSNGNYQEPAYNPVTGNAVVDRAYSYVGNAEYAFGACSPGQFDCSGFVSYCLTGGYGRLGSTSTFLGWTQVSDPQPGDVAVNAGHCGIYIGGGQMIHCADYGVGVIVGPVQGGMVFVRP